MWEWVAPLPWGFRTPAWNERYYLSYRIQLGFPNRGHQEPVMGGLGVATPAWCMMTERSLREGLHLSDEMLPAAGPRRG